ncbi:hypothetical protein CRUP_029769 [Coryphaenoides rupestris]|nr:hypothetical protein CRUP_029769 [Coryphaenoides rupestris]
MGRRAGSAPGGPPGGRRGEDFSFVSPVVKYTLCVFNMIFWVIALVMVSIGVYARVSKHAETAMACLSVDPAMLLMVVGVLMFFITFCGCVGSLRENICLLQTFCVCLALIFLLQLAAGVLGFIFSDKARTKVTELINNAIVHYRDDLDLQNLIDFGQKELQNYLEAGKVIHTNGCIDKLVNWIHSNMFLLGGVALGLAIPQLVGIMLSQILINQLKDQIELQNYNLRHRTDPWS